MRICYLTDFPGGELPVERAYELIKPFIGKEGVRGIYLVGSASRPFRDKVSDYDFEVIMDDAIYEKLSFEERHSYVIDPGPPRRVDYEFYLRPWSELASLVESVRDIDHYPFQQAKLLWDSDGAAGELIHSLGELPPGIADIRSRIHYLQFWMGTGRSRKCFARGDETNTRLVLSDSINALIKLLFITRKQWPSTKHWTTQELSVAGIPREITDQIGKVLATPTPEDVQSLMALTDEWLDGLSLTYHKEKQDLFTWAFLTAEGRAAMGKWS